MGFTGNGAYEAVRAHHQMLSEQLASRTAAVSEAVAAGRPHQLAVADLIAYLAEEVMLHAAAEEKTADLAAAAHDDLIGTVNEMAAEDGCTEEGATPAPDAGMTDGDLAGALLGLLLEAATALARTGQGDLGSRLAAAAWALLRQDRPDLAVAATAALHRLARLSGDGTAADGQPARNGGPAAGSGRRAGESDLDVRTLAPAQRHEAIFAAYRDLDPGSGFVLVNDHDPKPLRYQFEAEHAGEFTWDYLDSGPREWRVRIGRPKA